MKTLRLLLTELFQLRLGRPISIHTHFPLPLQNGIAISQAIAIAIVQLIAHANTPLRAIHTVRLKQIFYGLKLAFNMSFDIITTMNPLYPTECNKQIAVAKPTV